MSQYHIRKLVKAGLIRQEGGGYVVDKVIFDNVVRFRRRYIPIQTAYIAFFVVSLAVMLTFFRPTTLTAAYLFALLVMLVGALITAYEAAKTLSRL